MWTWDSEIPAFEKWASIFKLSLQRKKNDPFDNYESRYTQIALIAWQERAMQASQGEGK